MKTNFNGLLFLLSMTLAIFGILTSMIGFSYFFQSGEEWMYVIKEVDPKLYPLYALALLFAGMASFFLPLAIFFGRILKQNRDQNEFLERNKDHGLGHNFTILLALTLFMCSCGPSAEQVSLQGKNGGTTSTRVMESDLSGSITVKVIDGCEYIVLRAAHGAAITHKANCKNSQAINHDF